MPQDPSDPIPPVDPALAALLPGLIAQVQGLAAALAALDGYFASIGPSTVPATPPETVVVPQPMDVPQTGGGDPPTGGGLDPAPMPDGETMRFGGTIFFDRGMMLDGLTQQSIACFAAGTRVLTARGEVAVEALRAGDAVATLSGLRPVRWVGRRRIDCRRHPAPGAVLPVRVRGGAFAPGVPHRDLFLSPDHAVFAEGVLIPVRYLVDGEAVAQVARRSVTYVHVELDRHAVLLADGLPCESYLDTGNRSCFEGGGPALALHPDFARDVWVARACAPQVTHGPLLEMVRRRLRGGAAAGRAAASR